MKKAPRKYLLTVCILLLTSYGWLYAISNQEFSIISHGKTQIFPAYSGFCHEAISQASITKKSVSGRKANSAIYYEEKEEECSRFFVLKTFTEPGARLNGLSPKTFRRFFPGVKLVLPTCEHWFYTSSQRFSILRVMRI